MIPLMSYYVGGISATLRVTSKCFSHLKIYRILTVRLKLKPFNIAVIVVYILTVQNTKEIDNL